MNSNDVVIDGQSYNLRGPMEMHLTEDYVVYAIEGTIYVVSWDKIHNFLQQQEQQYPYQ